MKTKLLMKAGKFLTKQSPTILAVMSAIGAVTAVGLAIYATKKSIDEIHENSEDLYENPSEEKQPGLNRTYDKKKVVKLIWKHYIPAAVILAVSIVCIFGSNHVNLKRNAMLAASYLAVNEKFEDYKSAAREVLGDKKEKEVADKCAENRMKKSWNEGNRHIFETGHGNTLCYDDYTGRLFKCDLEHIRKIVNNVNYDLGRQLGISANEYYQDIGLEPVGCGREMGWREGRQMDPVYSSFLTDFGQPCISIDITPNMQEV